MGLCLDPLARNEFKTHAGILYLEGSLHGLLSWVGFNSKPDGLSASGHVQSAEEDERSSQDNHGHIKLLFYFS